LSHPYLLFLGILNLVLGFLDGFQARTGRRLIGRRIWWSDRTAAVWAVAYGVVGTALVVYSFS
jgi:hypothetical protein